MKFSEFRKKTAVDNADAEKPTIGEPAAGAKATSGDEKDHQNNDLLQVGKPRVKAWVPKLQYLQAESTKVHHKVKVHFDGHSEIRFVDDDELNVLRRSKRIKRVDHVGRVDDNGHLIEYVINENQQEEFYTHRDGRKASVISHKYADERLGTDHYVHLPDTRTTVFDDKDKALKLLKRLGYKPAQQGN